MALCLVLQATAWALQQPDATNKGSRLSALVIGIWFCNTRFLLCIFGDVFGHHWFRALEGIFSCCQQACHNLPTSDLNYTQFCCGYLTEVILLNLCNRIPTECWVSCLCRSHPAGSCWDGQSPAPGGSNPGTGWGPELPAALGCLCTTSSPTYWAWWRITGSPGCKGPGRGFCTLIHTCHILCTKIPGKTGTTSSTAKSHHS